MLQPKNEDSVTQNLLTRLRTFAKERQIPIVRPGTERVLADLVRCKNPKRILEIGTAIGYSGIVMLKNSVGTLTTLEMSAPNVALARKNFAEAELTERVSIDFCDARIRVPQLIDSFDFIFMDGPKASYVDFLPYLADRLAEGGILMADDVYFHGLLDCPPKEGEKHYVIATQLKKFLTALEGEHRLLSSLWRLEDGIAICVKRRKDE